MKKLLLLLITLCVTLAAKAVDYKVLDTRYSLGYTSYVVEYTSVAADGKTPMQISGVVTVPNSYLLSNADVLVVDSHHTVCDNASVPSVMGSSMCGMVMAALYPMAATDYVGYGITSDLAHPYLSQEQNARNSLDIVPVALDILAQNEVTPKMLYNIGYSQGGGVALAAQKLLENDAQYADLKKQFPLGVHAACGSGPYDPVATGADIYAKEEKVTFPAVLPLLVNGFLSGASAELTQGLKFADFFQPALTTPATLTNPKGEKIEFPGLETVVSQKEAGNDSVSSLMVMATGGKDGLADFFSADMMNKESDTYTRFFTWLAENNLCTGWKPEGEVNLFHLVEDDIVTSENTILAADGLGIPSDRVHFYNAADLDISGSNKHTQFAIPFFLNALKAIQGSLVDLDVIEIQLDADAPCYDLQGRRVGEDYHGIVIQGGRTFMK